MSDRYSISTLAKHSGLGALLFEMLHCMLTTLRTLSLHDGANTLTTWRRRRFNVVTLSSTW